MKKSGQPDSSSNKEEPAEMDENNQNELDDSALFLDAMQDVQPLKQNQNRITPEREKKPPIPHKTIEDEQQVLVDMLSDEYEPLESNASDQLYFARPGIQHSVMRKLKRGQFSIAAELDMHGMTVEIARRELIAFLEECQDYNARCVRIIHGKGRGSDGKGAVLKQRVDHWLPQRKDVLAYCSTIPAHGGTGAVYVLLKTR